MTNRTSEEEIQKIAEYIKGKKTEGLSDQEIDKLVMLKFKEFKFNFSTCNRIDRAIDSSQHGGYWRESFNFPNKGDLIEHPMDYNIYKVKTSGFFTFDFDMSVLDPWAEDICDFCALRQEKCKVCRKDFCTYCDKEEVYLLSVFYSNKSYEDSWRPIPTGGIKQKYNKEKMILCKGKKKVDMYKDLFQIGAKVNEGSDLRELWDQTLKRYDYQTDDVVHFICDSYFVGEFPIIFHIDVKEVEFDRPF